MPDPSSPGYAVSNLAQEARQNTLITAFMTEEEAKSFKSFRDDLNSGRVQLKSGPVASSLPSESPRDEFLANLRALMEAALENAPEGGYVRMAVIGNGPQGPRSTFVNVSSREKPQYLNSFYHRLLDGIRRHEKSQGSKFRLLAFVKG
jgi:hypothetical protein